jgi:hypothetical protein
MDATLFGTFALTRLVAEAHGSATDRQTAS